MPVFRTDFHHHCNIDPVDVLFYSPQDLITHAKSFGIDALAITPHGEVYHDPQVIEWAKDQGVLLMPAIEKRIEGKEVLLINVTKEQVPRKMNFSDLKHLKEFRGDDFLTIAPHPFYPMRDCLRRELMDLYVDLIDAVEWAHFYFPFANPYNQEAKSWAKENGKPLLANSDTHTLSMLGRNYSEVTADELTPSSLFNAIRAQQVRYVSRPPSPYELLDFIAKTVMFQPFARRIAGRGKHLRADAF